MQAPGREIDHPGGIIGRADTIGNQCYQAVLPHADFFFRGLDGKQLFEAVENIRVKPQ